MAVCGKRVGGDTFCHKNMSNHINIRGSLLSDGMETVRHAEGQALIRLGTLDDAATVTRGYASQGDSTAATASSAT